MIKAPPARAVPLENIRQGHFLDSQEFFQTLGLRHLGIARVEYTRRYINCSADAIVWDARKYFAQQVVLEYPQATHVFEYLADPIDVRSYITEVTEHSNPQSGKEYTFYITGNVYENPYARNQSHDFKKLIKALKAGLE